MEEIEKYIFDPNAPEKFTAHQLLVKVSGQKPNAVFLDEHYFLEFYQKEVFDQEFKNLLWEVPNNYDDLSSSEKKNLFIKNYSSSRYYEYLDKKFDYIINNNNKKFIDQFLTFNDGKKEITLSIDNFPNHHFRFTNNILGHNRSESFSVNFSWKYNLIFFLEEMYSYFLNKIASTKRFAILIINLDAYGIKQRNIFDYGFNYLSIFLRDNPQIKPIFLKKSSDIHSLLNFLEQDTKKQSIATPSIEIKEIPYVKSLSLKNYYTIQNLVINDLQDKKEIYFLGQNGVGKTKLLQAILLAIRGNPNEGIVSDIIKENPNQSPKLEAKMADGTSHNYTKTPSKKEKIYKNVLAYGVNRFRNDSEKKDETGFLTLFDTEQYLNSPEQWLKYLDYKALREEPSNVNLNDAKAFIRDILRDITKIEVTPDRVLFYEKDLPRTFNQLSDGFRTLISWICDLTIRLAEKQSHATSTKDFRGIVLVDEIGMFLHPTWQYNLMKKIKDWFPYIQFIFTTHSPIEIMGASRDAVFYKLYKEDGLTKISKPVNADRIANLMLNSIATAPFLFGLQSAKSAAFDDEKDDLDTSDDYLYTKIHQAIKQRVFEKQNTMTEKDIIDLINAELDQLETTLNK